MQLEIKLEKTTTETIVVYKKVTKKEIREEMDLEHDEDPEDYVSEYIEQIYTDLADLAEEFENGDGVVETDVEFEIDEVEIV